MRQKQKCEVCGIESGNLKMHSLKHKNMSNEPIQEPQPDKVMVEKSFLEDLRKEMDANKDTIKMLMEVADKSRLAQYYAGTQKKMPSEMRLRTYTIDGKVKVILGWQMIIDEVYMEAGRLIEKQTLKLIFEDGTSMEETMMNFVRRYQFVETIKIGERTDEQGNVIVKVKRKDNGKEYEIDVRYVN